MRLPFIGPPEDEIVAIATDLIVRHGVQAHDEALYLVEVAAHIGANKNRQLYLRAAREIEKSFAQAKARLQGRSEAVRTAGLPAARTPSLRAASNTEEVRARRLADGGDA
jgi:hypothetical protein